MCSAKQRLKFSLSITLTIFRSTLKKVLNHQLGPSTVYLPLNREPLKNSLMRTSTQDLSGPLSLYMEHLCFLSRRKIDCFTFVLTFVISTTLQKNIATYFCSFPTFQTSLTKLASISRYIFITLTTQSTLLKMTNKRLLSIPATDPSNSLSYLLILPMLSLPFSTS